MEKEDRAVSGFGDKVRDRLTSIGLSQEQLAERMGTTQSQVSRWVNPSVPPKARPLLRMARILGVTADFLIDPDQVEFPQASDREMQVREIASRFGWDWVYWRLIDAQAGGDHRGGIHRDPETGEKLPERNQRGKTA